MKIFGKAGLAGPDIKKCLAYTIGKTTVAISRTPPNPRFEKLQIMEKLASRFPKLYGIYSQFTTGSKQLYKDGKLAITFKPEQGGRYTPHEIVTHHHFGQDLRKCLPLFVIFWIPVVGVWISLPLAAMFPNVVLSRQFWTDKQRKSALDRMLAYRTQVYPQLAVSLLKSLDNQEMDKKLSQTSCDIVNQIIAGAPLHREESDVLRSAFSSKSMQKLRSDHSLELRGALAATNLKKHAEYLINVDQSLKQHRPEDETDHILDLIANQRGYFIGDYSIEDKINYVDQWLSHSHNIKTHEVGYLLHLPMLMSHNALRIKSDNTKKKEKTNDDDNL